MVEKTTGLWMGSLIFAVLGVVAAIILSLYVYVRTQEDRSKGEQLKKPNAIMAFFLTLFATICMWGMWICVYMHQMNPLILPELEAHE